MNTENTIIHSTLEEGYDFFITDKWNKKYHFKISTFTVPSGLLSEALEVIDDETNNEPRVFHILSEFDSDIEKAELLLKGKIKKGINKRYLENRNGRISICDDLEVAGRIEWSDNPNESNFDTYFVIDGKKITIENFVDMLQAFGGYNFKFQVIDTTDEIS